MYSAVLPIVASAVLLPQQHEQADPSNFATPDWALAPPAREAVAEQPNSDFNYNHMRVPMGEEVSWGDGRVRGRARSRSWGLAWARLPWQRRRSHGEA